MRTFILSLTLIILSFGLNACETGGDPKPMGRGYIAFEDKYKSAPGAETRSIGYAYDTTKNNAVLEDLRFAAADLVTKLDQNLSFSDDKIHLTHPENSAFYNSFDHLLRDELVKSGYIISQTPEESSSVTFIAQEAPHNDGKKIVKNDYRQLYLELAIDAHDGKPSRYVGGIYEVPAYDFQPKGIANPNDAAKKYEPIPASLQRIE